jgi:hypothetical protein
MMTHVLEHLRGFDVRLTAFSAVAYKHSCNQKFENRKKM